MKRDNFMFEIIEILNTITVDFYDEMLNKLRFLFKRDNNINIIQINYSHNLSNFNDFNQNNNNYFSFLFVIESEK